MVAKKSTAPTRSTVKAVAPVVAVKTYDVKTSKAKTPAKAAAVQAAPIKAEPVKAAPAKVAPVKAAPVKAAPVAAAIVAEAAPTASAIEDVVGISPVVESLTADMAELPKRISGVMTEMTKTQTEVKTQMEKAVKTAEDFVSFSQGNVEALLKSSQIWATGLQDLSKHFAATAQSQIDETVATVKALSSVKSLKEAMDLQSSLAKTAMEKMVAETGKISDASMKLAEQTIAPLTARVTLAAEKFGKTV